MSARREGEARLSAGAGGVGLAAVDAGDEAPALEQAGERPGSLHGRRDKEVALSLGAPGLKEGVASFVEKRKPRLAGCERLQGRETQRPAESPRQTPPYLSPSSQQASRRRIVKLPHA